MNMNARLQELRRKHSTVSEQVDMAQRSPGVPDAEIAALKKKKLKLKDEIERIATL